MNNIKLICLSPLLILMLSGCVTQSSDNLTETPSIKTLPSNNGGIEFEVPVIAESGNVVPVTVTIKNPVLPGDILV